MCPAVIKEKWKRSPFAIVLDIFPTVLFWNSRVYHTDFYVVLGFKLLSSTYCVNGNNNFIEMDAILFSTYHFKHVEAVVWKQMQTMSVKCVVDPWWVFVSLLSIFFVYMKLKISSIFRTGIIIYLMGNKDNDTICNSSNNATFM